MTTASTQVRRPENLALIYQEVLTAIVRLHGNRQSVSDPEAFRQHIREALKTAARDAAAAGYEGDDIKRATFAVVAFLDESVLNSQNAIFGDWVKKPLQEELFGTHVAGDVFFQNVDQLLGRADSLDLADLLEVHYLCLLLGFGGRYSANRGELGALKDLVARKMTRIRGDSGPLSPSAALPDEAVSYRKDPWVPRLTIASIVGAILLIGLFVGYKTNLHSAITDLGNIPTRVEK